MREVLETDERLVKTLVVTEIFRSIQGESTWAGLPCIFVRLTGCSVRCAYCDTTYAYDGGTIMTVGEIVEKCAALSGRPDLRGRLVEVTGGEPLEQAECPALVACLLERGVTVLVETNGTLPIDRLPDAGIKIMDIKCPGSGVSEKTDWANMKRLSPRDEVKFVICDRSDYDWSREVISKYDLVSRCKEVLISPVFGRIEPRVIAAWILEDRLDVRLQLQLHKFIWPPDCKGV